jgi:hypothetical protein
MPILQCQPQVMIDRPKRAVYKAARLTGTHPLLLATRRKDVNRCALNPVAIRPKGVAVNFIPVHRCKERDAVRHGRGQPDEEHTDTEEDAAL